MVDRIEPPPELRRAAEAVCDSLAEGVEMYQQAVSGL
jgi:hypothetical protein